MSNVFEIAAKNKYRFKTQSGNLTVEDLFDLPIKSDTGKLDLYSIAKSLAKGLGETDNELLSSIFNESVKVNTDTKNMFDIVQRVVEIKREENEKRATKAKNKADKERLLEILAKKQDQSLESLTEEQILAKLKELD